MALEVMELVKELELFPQALEGKLMLHELEAQDREVL